MRLLILAEAETYGRSIGCRWSWVVDGVSLDWTLGLELSFRDLALDFVSSICRQSESKAPPLAKSPLGLLLSRREGEMVPINGMTASNLSSL